MKFKSFLAACVSAMPVATVVADGGTADCVRNGSFEAGTKYWQLTNGWSVGRGFGRNGSGGLVFESAAKTEKMVFAEQIVDVVPGKIYDFETWLDAPKGVSMSIHFLDGKGKRVGGMFSGARSGSKGWARLWVRTTRLPGDVRKVRLRPFVPAGFTGKACFDDISFSLHEVEPVTTICSSCYHDEATPDDGKVTFFAGIDLDDSGCTSNEVDMVFSFDSPSGARVRRKADRFVGMDASVEVAQDDIKMGAQEVAAEVVKRDGAAIGRRTLKFTRLAARPPLPVHIDRWNRTVVGGKPFFPIAIYCSRAESNQIERVGKAPFNTLMAYSKLDWTMLDWCKENGLMAIAHVGDLSSYDTSIARRVSKIKDHPAMLAWLINDERPLAMMPKLISRYRAVREADPGHPTWAVLYQVDQMRGYIGTCDAIGSDPYPISHASFTLAHKWVEKTRSATFGAIPVWQTIQIFDWAAYKTKAEPGADVSKFRAPTLAEMKIMAWFQIAGGANALLMYSYNPLEKMSWRDPFEVKWKEVCECAGEIASVSDILLSVEPPPVIGKVPKSLSVRTWRIGDTAYLLICNTTGKRLKTSVPLGAEQFEDMRTVYGGGVSMAEGNALAVDFPPEGYAFLSFKIRHRMRAVCKQGYHHPEGNKLPGNSLEAFKYGWTKGVKMIETDCWMIKGGRIICVHDPKVLKGHCGELYDIRKLTEEDVARIDIGRKLKTEKPVRMPYLDDVFATMPKDAIAQCELCGYTDTFADTFDAMRIKAGLSVTNFVISGGYERLLDFKRRYPEYRTLWLNTKFLDIVKDEKSFTAWLEKTRAEGFSIICPRGLKAMQVGFSPADADRVRAAGLELRIWGVNTPELLAYARDLKVPAATCARWQQVFEWAKTIPGLEVTP